MEPSEFNSFCGALMAANYVNQWKGAHVWKVGGKVFAIGRRNRGRHSGITVKVSPIACEVLKNTLGFRPAPYFASRGMTWVQYYLPSSLLDRDIKLYMKESHRLVSLGLTKKKQNSLGLTPA